MNPMLSKNKIELNKNQWNKIHFFNNFYEL